MTPPPMANSAPDGAPSTPLVTVERSTVASGRDAAPTLSLPSWLPGAQPRGRLRPLHTVKSTPLTFRILYLCTAQANLKLSAT